MASKKRPSKKLLQVEVPEALARRLDDLLAQTGRSLSDEVSRALDLWLERQGMGESAVEETPPRAAPAVPPARQLEDAGESEKKRRGPPPRPS
jgi:hypothetical protein